MVTLTPHSGNVVVTWTTGASAQYYLVRLLADAGGAPGAQLTSSMVVESDPHSVTFSRAAGSYYVEVRPYTSSNVANTGCGAQHVTIP